MALQIENPPSESAKPALLRYLDSMFRRVAQDLTSLRIQSLTSFVAKGYGGISIGSANVFPDITGSIFYKIDIFDQANITEPVDVVQNVANSSLDPQRRGVWQFTFIWAFNHNELNAGRFYTMQLYNETDSTVLAEFQFGTGRNVDISSGSVSFLGTLPASAEGDSLIWRIGDASVYTVVVFRTLSFNMNHISELGGG